MYQTDHIVMQKSIHFSIVTLRCVFIVNLNLVKLSYLKIQLLSQNQAVKTNYISKQNIYYLN